MLRNKHSVLVLSILLFFGSSRAESESEDVESNGNDNRSIAKHDMPQNATKRSEGMARACRDCEGCELLFGGSVIEPESFKFPSVVSSPKTSVETREALQETYKNLVKMVVALNPVMPGPVGNLIAVGDGVFTAVIALATGSNNDLWSRIERRVEAKIEQYATYNHFKDLENSGYWIRSLDTLRTCPELIKIDDLKDMLQQKSMIFPQNNDDVSFTPQWAISINTFTMNIVATYLELIRNGRIPKCGLHEELTALRGDVINALKSLQSKRWRAIRGHDYASVNSFNQTASLQFKDETTGELWPATFTDADRIKKDNQIQSVKPFLFNEIMKDTKKMIYPIRERFNSILGVTSTLLADCQGGPIDEIPESVMNNVYPTNCYGQAEAGELPCLLPCEMYGTTEYWCPNNLALHRKKASSKRRKIFSLIQPEGRIIRSVNNAKCTPQTSIAQWKECNPDGYNKASNSVIFTAQWGRRRDGDKKKNLKKEKTKKEKKTKN